ncbi:hypothetical protein Syun_007765 [Stephania yunnanensis]|uniref:Uncharacterized protein n=1 Tax=Stephania yunnanensis TaxID=152371 RepID=A0AAP0Q0J7_9MAGN
MSLNLLLVIILSTKPYKNCTELLHATSFNPQQINNKCQCIFAIPKQKFP